MLYEKRSAWRYRARAEELRTLADFDRSQETRRILMRVAEDYERIAASMEAIAESHFRLNTGRFAPAQPTTEGANRAQ